MYSSIKRKSCKCGCGKNPTMSCSGYNYNCLPSELKEKLGTKRDLQKKAKAARNRVSNLLNKDSEAEKTKLLAMADKLFGDFIKFRDSDLNGSITCICCGFPFNLKDKALDGTYVVQPLHFVSRSVYSLRFDERQVYAGCCYCNLQMYLHPTGKEVQSYQDKLVDKFGIVEVMRMVEQKRRINKLTIEDLKEVISKYK